MRTSLLLELFSLSLTSNDNNHTFSRICNPYVKYSFLKIAIFANIVAKYVMVHLLRRMLAFRRGEVSILGACAHTCEISPISPLLYVGVSHLPLQSTNLMTACFSIYELLISLQLDWEQSALLILYLN